MKLATSPAATKELTDEEKMAKGFIVMESFILNADGGMSEEEHMNTVLEASGEFQQDIIKTSATTSDQDLNSNFCNQ